MSQTFERFGKYTLMEKIASGGMAEVYLANLKAAGGVNKFVGIKRILPQFSDNPDFVKMFKEEAKIAANLNHGNVVSIYDFGMEKGQFFLVMEFVEGKNLRQILNELKRKQQQLSIDQIVFMIKEASAGLDHAHRCIDSSTGKPLNITHRDISPQNIMLSYEGEVKIIDFGIAKAETQLEATRAGTLKGKFGYMSPEQADGLQVDSRTDVFSLGIVLWELLANERLFSGTSEPAILRKIKECQIPSLRKINPTIPVELEKIVLKCLVKDRNLRYQTATAMHRDLNRFLNTQYPEFSTHDFGLFIKTLLVQSFQEHRKKMMEFANISQKLGEELKVPAPPPASQTHSTHVLPTDPFGELSNQMAKDSPSVNLAGHTHTELDAPVDQHFPASESPKKSYRIQIPDTSKEKNSTQIEIVDSGTARPPQQKPGPTLAQKKFQPELTSSSTTTRSQIYLEKKRSPYLGLLVSLGLIVALVVGAKLLWPKESFLNHFETAVVNILGSTARPTLHLILNEDNAQVGLKGPKGNRITPIKTLSSREFEFEISPNLDYTLQVEKEGFGTVQIQVPVRPNLFEQNETITERNFQILYHQKENQFEVRVSMEPSKAEVSQFRLSLQTTPPGAQIELEGENLGAQTPHIFPISKQKPFKIRLIKSGYLTFETTIDPQSEINNQNLAHSLNVHLLSPQQSGFVTLSIPIAGARTIIKIQATSPRVPYSQTLVFDEPGPFEFAIPSGVDVNITAINPRNAAVGSKDVRISPQSRNNFELFLETP